MTRLTAEQRTVVSGGLLGVLGAAAGVLLYLASEGHGRHDPRHELQQLDLLYLDEPAPGYGDLGLRAGQPVVVVFCPGQCLLPVLDGAQVVRSDDVDLARLYALGEDGRTGFALVDRQGDVRYRSYDPAPHEHVAELQTLVDAL